jgi:hypothetical protein
LWATCCMFHLDSLAIKTILSTMYFFDDFFLSWLSPQLYNWSRVGDHRSASSMNCLRAAGQRQLVLAESQPYRIQSVRFEHIYSFWYCFMRLSLSILFWHRLLRQVQWYNPSQLFHNTEMTGYSPLHSAHSWLGKFSQQCPE